MKEVTLAIVSTKERLDIATVRHQLQYVSGSVLPAVGSALLLFLALQHDNNRFLMRGWCAAFLLFKLIAAVHARRTLAQPFPHSQVRGITLTQSVLYALQGGLWGGLAWIAMRPGEIVDTLLVVAATSGLASSAVPYLSANLPVFYSFLLTMFLGVFTRLISFDDTAFHFLAAMAIAIPVSLIPQARNSARATRESIAVRYENLDLVFQLRQETDRSQRAYEAARQANEAKLRFLAAASHDLRQPVHSLGLFLEALGRSRLSSDQQEMLIKARAASDASVSMLNALLDFSRLEAGVIKPAKRAIALQAVLDKLEVEYAEQANAQDLVYRSRHTPLVVNTDPVLLELVLRNLVTNAIRYSVRGGVLVACRRRGQQAILEVWDTGIGIPAQKLDEVFGEFSQLHNPERDQRKGLGLGLAIARGLARLMNTEVSVSSVLGRGSVFRITLPLSQEVPASSHESPPAPLIRAGLRVLIIDDVAFVRDSTLLTVAGWGCRGEAVETLEQARESAQRQRPDIVICDYRLRESRTGADAIAVLRAICGKDLPIILITGDTAPERIREAMNLGVPLLHKPVSADILQQAVADALS